MIKFGTSGWRAIMGKEFTFKNVRIVVQAIANILKTKFPTGDISVIIAYDTRFLSERFAFEAAKVLSHNDVFVFLADRDAPSQALAYQIIKKRAQAGINFTASFNPPVYNGLKYNTETGAPALPAETDRIENEAGSLAKDFSFTPYYPKPGFITKIDLQKDYLAYLQNEIDFDLIRKAKIKVGVDLLYGTSREYLDEILEENQIPLEEIHGYIDPYFGGLAPSCTEANLAELKQLVRKHKCHLGIATDCDGDRFGILDENGNFIVQNIVLSLLLEYLVTVKGWKGGVARSVATTHMIDRIARHNGLPLMKTPVGFKYLAHLFLENKIMFGGEESACLAVRGHLPEKDGIMAGLLVTEMIAALNKGLSAQISDLFKKYGPRYGKQKEIPLKPDRELNLNRLFKSPPERVDGRTVVNVETLDGIKLDFANDDWILLRMSGTEPLIRAYAEAENKKETDKLMKIGLELIGA